MCDNLRSIFPSYIYTLGREIGVYLRPLFSRPQHKVKEQIRRADHAQFSNLVMKRDLTQSMGQFSRKYVSSTMS